jgi:hypothetical protein
MAIKYIIVLFVETPRKFITAVIKPKLFEIFLIISKFQTPTGNDVLDHIDRLAYTLKIKN